jgi:hypothetical protein
MRRLTPHAVTLSTARTLVRSVNNPPKRARMRMGNFHRRPFGWRGSWTNPLPSPAGLPTMRCTQVCERATHVREEVGIAPSAVTNHAVRRCPLGGGPALACQRRGCLVMAHLRPRVLRLLTTALPQCQAQLSVTPASFITGQVWCSGVRVKVLRRTRQQVVGGSPVPDRSAAAGGRGEGARRSAGRGAGLDSAGRVTSC